jgi:hypothetical protein
MSEGNVSKKIRISKILKQLEKGRVSFICHAAERIFHKKEDTAFVCDGVATFKEFKKIIPEYMHDVCIGNNITLWTKGKTLPKYLRKSRRNDPADVFRIKLLKWIIEEFGDQKLKFRFSE